MRRSCPPRRSTWTFMAYYLFLESIECGTVRNSNCWMMDPRDAFWRAFCFESTVQSPSNNSRCSGAAAAAATETHYDPFRVGWWCYCTYCYSSTDATNHSVCCNCTSCSGFLVCLWLCGCGGRPFLVVVLRCCMHGLETPNRPAVPILSRAARANCKCKLQERPESDEALSPVRRFQMCQSDFSFCQTSDKSGWSV